MTKYPMLYVAVIFAVAIVTVSGMVADDIKYFVLGVSILFIVACVYKQKPDFWIVFMLFMTFLAGMAVTMISYEDANKFVKYSDGLHDVSGKVIDIQQSDKYERLTLEVTTIDDSRESGKLYIYVMHSEKVFDYGEEISFTEKIRIPSAPIDEDEPDYRPYHYTEGIKGTVMTSVSKITRLGINYSPFELTAIGYGIRESVRHTVQYSLPPDQASFLLALLLGDKSGMNDDLKDYARRSGTSHIIAVSGMHVSMFLAFFAFITRFLASDYKKSAIIGLIALGLLSIILSGSPGILRAYISALIYIVASLWDKRGEAISSLGLSALCILAITPYALFDLRFILSFASIVGVIALNKIFKQGGGIVRQSLYSLFTCICASFGPVLFVANLFGEIPLTGILTNVIAIPLVAVITPMGCVMCITGVFWLPLSEAIGSALYFLLIVLKWSMSVGADLPFATLQVPKPDFVTVLIYLAACGLTVYLGNLYKKRKELKSA